MADQTPVVTSFVWNSTSTNVVYRCVCNSEITATIFRNGQRDFQIQGSSVQPVVGGNLEGNKFNAHVAHCNFIVNILCDGTSGTVDVDTLNNDD